MEFVTLNNSVKMPLVGFGVFQIEDAAQCEQCVLDALDVGYRLIDTAQAYYNEKAVGRALQKTSVPREEIFLTTKVWVTEFGYEKAKASVLESMRKLQVDYLDLVLIHQCLSDYYGAYHALEDLYAEGKIRAIGISNFSAERMADIATFNKVVPAVNQVETHLFWQQYELHEWMEKYHIQHEAWGPACPASYFRGHQSPGSKGNCRRSWKDSIPGSFTRHDSAWDRHHSKERQKRTYGGKY